MTAPINSLDQIIPVIYWFIFIVVILGLSELAIMKMLLGFMGKH